MKLPPKINSRPFYQSAGFAICIILLLFVLGWWQELLNLRAVNFTGGDGGKNQFVFLDYVLNGDGLMDYGMNYPFGEHITFTDNQPPLAILFKFIHEHIISLDDSILSIHNFWVLFQIPLGAVAFYFFLRNVLDISWLALIGAILIVYLSPQLTRLHSHFSLSYIFIYAVAFNCLWHILINKRVVFYSIFLCLLAFLGGFSHLYNYMGIFLFALFFNIIGFFTGHLKLKQVVFIFSSLLVAAISILFLVRFLDPFPLRPLTAEGLFNFSATFEGTFYPMLGKEAELFQQIFQLTKIPDGEGRNFLGIIAVLLNVIFLILYAFKKGFRTKKTKRIFLFWLSAFFVWLYASEVFFAPFDKEFILSLPYVSHFRGIGRFAVVFYYLVGVVGIVTLQYFWMSYSKIFKLVTTVLILLWGAESYYYQEGIKTEGQITMQGALFETKVFNLDSVLKANNRRVADYQCGLILPISSSCNFGNEHLGHYFTLHYGARMRLESGLPIMNSIFTRGAIDHGIGLAQLASSYPAEKILLPHLSDKKILIQYTADSTELTENNLRILEQATFIGAGNTCYYAEIEKKYFVALQSVEDDSMKTLEQNSVVPIVKRKLKKGEYELASYEIKDTSKGLRIKFNTSMKPKLEIADYWLDLFDNKGSSLGKIEISFNLTDYSGMANVKQAEIEPADLVDVVRIKLMTNKQNELTQQLSIIPF